MEEEAIKIIGELEDCHSRSITPETLDLRSLRFLSLAEADFAFSSHVEAGLDVVRQILYQQIKLKMKKQKKSLLQEPLQAHLLLLEAV